MATKSVKIFFILGIIFYVATGGYLWYSLDSIRSNRLSETSKKSEFIRTEVESAYSISLSFSSDYFKDRINNLFRSDQDIRALVISDSDGPLYFNSVSSNLIQEINGTPSLALSSPFLKEYKTNIFPEKSSGVEISVVFNLLDRASLFPVLRNTLIAVLLFILITIIIINLNSSQNVSESSGATSAAENPPEASEPRHSAASDTLDDTSAEDEEAEESDPDIPHQRQMPAVSGLYSEKSGLVWENFLNEKLDAELKRAASFDQDSCLVFISIISPSGFIPYRNISELIVEHFKYKDLAFEAGKNTFCVIIPDKDIDEGLSDVENFKKGIKARFPDSAFKIYAGLTSRNSRLLSENRMIHEAKAALARAESESDSTTISFRTDLNKYREYIASRI